MSLLIGSMTIGFILSLLALGVFLSFRVFAFPDITAEGSITLGASVAATLLVGGFSPLPPQWQGSCPAWLPAPRRASFTPGLTSTDSWPVASS